MRPVSSNRTLLFSVLYPGLHDAMVKDYVGSIMRQTDQAFDWLMVNDNCGNSQKHLFPPSVMWIDLATVLSFGKIRQMGVAFALERAYDYIIFSDIDDYYGENRIASSKLHLAETDFVFTELQVVDVHKHLIYSNLVSRLAVNPFPATINDILDHNYIGLSHSAIRLNALRELVIPATIDVVDWWVFSFLLINNRTGRFMPDVDTFYRQSDANYVGVFNQLDKTRLRRGIDVKLHHYWSLLEYCENRNLLDNADIFRTKWREMVALQQAVQDAGFAEQYISRINTCLSQIYKGWWSEILSLQKWEQL